MNLKIFTDGAARGNPGPAGIGMVLCSDKDEVLEKHCRYLGDATNNVAEYEALIAGMELARKYLPCSVRFYLDSELVVRQMQGKYRVKNEHLSAYFGKARALAADFKGVSFTHIPREQNKTADGLANQAIDEAKKNPSGTPPPQKTKSGQLELF